MKKFTTALMTTTLMVAAASLASTSAYATDGMFSNGTGARNKALAGAGVADQNDATAVSMNPAGLVNSDTQFSMSASVFSPRRDYDLYDPTSGARLYGDTSGANYFVVPNMAYNYKIDATSAFGISLYGNGGMNTTYDNGNFLTNVFGYPAGPDLGINLTQAILSVAYAKRFGSLSIGIAPTVGVQIFSADGLMGSEKQDVAAGIALRGGVEWAVAPSFRVGIAGSSPGYTQAFTHYNEPGELFGVSAGELRVPAYVQAGFAFDLMPTLTVMADYKRIFYGESEAIGTSTAEGGFGWSDINIYKVGVEWDVNPGLTLRAGYSYNDSPLSTDISSFTQNILAPATVQHHITGGAKLKMTDTMDFELAGMFAPKAKVSTPGYDLDGTFGNAPTDAPASTVSMYQWEATAGVIWHLGQPEAPLK